MDSSSFPPAPRYTGRTLGGRYTLEARLGMGSFAEVYRARNHSTGGLVAIKLLRREHLGSAAIRTRFTHEIETLARFRHPNIVQVFDAGEETWTEDGTSYSVPYLIMQLLGGESLRTLLRQRTSPLPWQATAPLLCDFLRALEALHRDGIVHRDLKPANAMITPSASPDARTLVLIDLGLASDMSDPSVSPEIGSPCYRAPERWEGKPADVRSDIYSIGVIFYELLTGSKPFYEPDVGKKHLQAELVPPRRRAPKAAIPEELEALVLRALQRDPAARFPSAAEFLRALEETIERITYNLPPTYGFLPRALRAWDSAVNEPLGDPSPPLPALATKTPSSAPPAAAPPAPRVSRVRMAVAATFGASTIAAALVGLGNHFASCPEPAPVVRTEPFSTPLSNLEAGALSEEAGSPVAVPPESSARQVQTEVHTPTGIDSAERPAEPEERAPEPAKKPGVVAPRPQRAKGDRTRNDDPPLRITSSISRVEPVTKEEAKAATAAVLDTLARTCTGVPTSLMVELDVVSGRARVIALNDQALSEGISWHSCASRVLEAVKFPNSSTPARLRLLLQVR